MCPLIDVHMCVCLLCLYITERICGLMIRSASAVLFAHYLHTFIILLHYLPLWLPAKYLPYFFLTFFVFSVIVSVICRPGNTHTHSSQFVLSDCATCRTLLTLCALFISDLIDQCVTLWECQLMTSMSPTFLPTLSLFAFIISFSCPQSSFVSATLFHSLSPFGLARATSSPPNCLHCLISVSLSLQFSLTQRPFDKHLSISDLSEDYWYTDSNSESRWLFLPSSVTGAREKWSSLLQQLQF